MRALLFLIVCSVAVAAQRVDPRAVKLEELKKEFPAHVVGPVDEKTDPIIQKSFSYYREKVQALTLATLQKELGEMREKLDFDIDVPGQFQAGKNVINPSSRHAQEQNLRWLKQKLRPYLNRLQSFQRGR